jgi:hypothetical protein
LYFVFHKRLNTVLHVHAKYIRSAATAMNSINTGQMHWRLHNHHIHMLPNNKHNAAVFAKRV